MTPECNIIKHVNQLKLQSIWPSESSCWVWYNTLHSLMATTRAGDVDAWSRQPVHLHPKVITHLWERYDKVQVVPFADSKTAHCWLWFSIAEPEPNQMHWPQLASPWTQNGLSLGFYLDTSHSILRHYFFSGENNRRALLFKEGIKQIPMGGIKNHCYIMSP